MQQQTIKQLFHELANEMTVVNVGLELMLKGDENGNTLQNSYKASRRSVEIIQRIRSLIFEDV